MRPKDQCSDLGTTHDGKRGCSVGDSDASDVGIDPDTGKCGNCLIGDCSITGREGGAEYRCVVPATEIAESATPPRFEPCTTRCCFISTSLEGGRRRWAACKESGAVKLHGKNETVIIYDDAALAGAIDGLDGGRRRSRCYYRGGHRNRR